MDSEDAPISSLELDLLAPDGIRSCGRLTLTPLLISAVTVEDE